MLGIRLKLLIGTGMTFGQVSVIWPEELQCQRLFSGNGPEMLFIRVRRRNRLAEWVDYWERVVVQERMPSREPSSARFVLPGDTTRPE